MRSPELFPPVTQERLYCPMCSSVVFIHPYVQTGAHKRQLRFVVFLAIVSLDEDIVIYGSYPFLQERGVYTMFLCFL